MVTNNIISMEQTICFILSDQILSSQTDLSVLHKKYLSQSGNTIALDFGIGNTKFLGKRVSCTNT